ncbi:MAG: HAMP domain-containing histidine kinase [Ruminococcaceae bacterium]|nr:HAMP domain-containing histidine kinase [Oscillospiraceae bacterium]
MKQNKKKNRTMTTYLWGSFAMFAIVIMVVLWLLQVIFLNTFYESMKKNEIEKIGDKLVLLYNSNSEEFENFWQRQVLRGGIFASILTEDGYIVKEPEVMKEFKKEFNRPPREKIKRPGNIASDLNPEIWNSFVQKISESENRITTYVSPSRGNGQILVYGAHLGDKDGEAMYLYLSSTIEPLDATRRVLQSQLIIVSILSLLTALALAYFIAKRFAGPITRISESAKVLASGNYDVHFERGSYREVTELSDVLNTAARQLGKTDELRRDLMANVSHDLKTPLTIIKSYAEMIRDISGDNEEKRSLHTGVIIDEANRLSVLVNDILALSKLESGILTPDKIEFSLSDAVESVTQKFLAFSDSDGYRFVTDVEENIFVEADRSQLVQVIYNLVGNAVNYTGNDKKVYISLKLRGENAHFEVKDTGDGIKPEDIPFVWERYYRSGCSHSREISGTGIGLAIVKRVLEAHGARYGVEQPDSGGSVFWFELPARH